MKLRELLVNTDGSNSSTDFADVDVSAITADSRKVVKASLFVALPGPQTDGTKFISQAIAQGASVIVSEKSFVPLTLADGIIYLQVPDSCRFLSQVLRNFYCNPASVVKLIGITGTNGKTTISYLLESLFAENKKVCGVIGTVNHRFGQKIFKASNTTPGLVENFMLLGEMACGGVEFCAIEVSSHALDQRRTEGMDFRYAIFTNLTSDHLDYHGTRENYFLAKAKLFTGLGPNRRAIINIDDEFGGRLKTMTTAAVWTYGIKNKADFVAQNIQLGFDETFFELLTPVGNVEIRTKLIGLHNIYNILPVVAVGIAEGLSLSAIKKAVECAGHVPGRLERIEAGQNFYVFIDYAHTQDALRNVLSTIRIVKQTRVIVVFGCGGDRDKTKRPLMARAAEELSDFVIVTTDNPRSEDPQQIVDEIVAGFQANNFKIVLDRAEAIRTALQMAREDDVVIIAGKGHENYQIFKDRTIGFDERAIVKESLSKNFVRGPSS